MVFGNKGEDSATGVCFTRNPSTGEQGVYGEYLVNAQGEDVVAGIRTPRADRRAARAHARGVRPAPRDDRAARAPLPRHAGHRVHRRAGHLYLLQTRTAKRTAAAAIKFAVDMTRRADRAGRGRGADRSGPARPAAPPASTRTPSSRSPRRASTPRPALPAAQIVLDADSAEERGKAGEAVILVRWETTPDDIHGLIQAQASSRRTAG